MDGQSSKRLRELELRLRARWLQSCDGCSASSGRLNGQPGDETEKPTQRVRMRTEPGLRDEGDKAIFVLARMRAFTIYFSN